MYRHSCFCRTIVAQQDTNLLNDSACTGAPGTSQKAPKLLLIKSFGAFCL